MDQIIDQRGRKRRKIWSAVSAKIAVIFAVILGNMLLPAMTFAQTGPVWVSIPVQVQTSGNAPSGMTYQIELARKMAGAPMPERAESADRFVLTAKTGETIVFDRIAYSVPGDYRYQITQTTKEQSRYIFDRSVYEVTVHVFNREDGGLESEISAQKRDTESQEEPGAKAESILFANQYTRSSGGGGHSGGGSSSGSSSSSGNSSGTAETAAGEQAETFPEILFPENETPAPLFVPVTLPKTGDLTHEWFWALLAGISAVAGIALSAHSFGSYREQRKKGRTIGRTTGETQKADL